jgi:hypothetical protein
MLFAQTSMTTICGNPSKPFANSSHNSSNLSEEETEKEQNIEKQALKLKDREAGGWRTY